MGAFDIKIERLGTDFLLISWPNKISVEISEELLAFEKAITQQFHDFILVSNPAYASLCVHYHREKINFTTIKNKLLEAYRTFVFNRVENKKYWEIPVCYDPELGPDFLACCEQKMLTPETFISLHTEPYYRIYFIGFLPGFLYLGGLNQQLFIPRKATPRPKVPKGAVGIAGSQTGIYPQASPGGWQLIGQTKVSLFDADQQPPTLFQAGDYIKFTAISRADFAKASHLPVLKNRRSDG